MRKFGFAFFFVIAVFGVAAEAQTGVFTYQGRLNDATSPANGTYEMQFSLFDSLAGPTQIGTTIANSTVLVTNGVFTVDLNFSPATPFASGADRFLAIAVRKASDPPGFTPLTPRKQIMSAPYSIRSDSANTAATAGNVTGVVQIANGGTGSATKNFVDLTTNQAAIAGNKTFTGAVGVSGGSGVFNGNGSGLTNLNGANINANSVTTTQLSAETLPNSTAFKLLGSLRWDLLKGQATFPVGSGPSAVAFDGANMWVTNQGNNDVTKLRASDGTNLGTFPVGTNPVGIAFDGAHLWVTNNGSNNVTKLRASDGANLGTFLVGTGPQGVAFDGANIWVANINSSNLTRLRASDGANLGTFLAGINPFGLAFDGANIWVANASANTVTRLRASDGVNLGTFGVGGIPFAVAFDGANIWVVNNSTTNVTKLRASDGGNLGTFAVGANPQGIAFDGTNIWIASFNANNATKLRASDGASLGTFPTGSAPIGIAFDGANIWMTNSGSNNVTRLLPAFPQN